MSNPIFTAYSHSDLFGKLIFLALFLSSCLSWTLIIQRWLSLKKDLHECKILKSLFLNTTINPIEKQKKEFETPFLQNFRHIVYQPLKKNHEQFQQTILSPNDIAQIEKEALQYIDQKIHACEKNLSILSMITTLAPFLGLLGTVWGILLTFYSLDNQALGQEQMANLAMALATTVVGLIVAIPALVGTFALKTKSNQLTSEFELINQRWLGAISFAYGKELQ